MVWLAFNSTIGNDMSNFETVLVKALLETNEEFEKDGLLNEDEKIENVVQMTLFEADSSLSHINNILDHIMLHIG